MASKACDGRGGSWVALRARPAFVSGFRRDRADLMCRKQQSATVTPSRLDAPQPAVRAGDLPTGCVSASRPEASSGSPPFERLHGGGSRPPARATDPRSAAAGPPGRLSQRPPPCPPTHAGEGGRCPGGHADIPPATRASNVLAFLAGKHETWNAPHGRPQAKEAGDGDGCPGGLHSPLGSLGSRSSEGGHRCVGSLEQRGANVGICPGAVSRPGAVAASLIRHRAGEAIVTAPLEFLPPCAGNTLLRPCIVGLDRCALASDGWLRGPAAPSGIHPPHTEVEPPRPPCADLPRGAYFSFSRCDFPRGPVATRGLAALPLGSVTDGKAHAAATAVTAAAAAAPAAPLLPQLLLVLLLERLRLVALPSAPRALLQLQLLRCAGACEALRPPPRRPMPAASRRRHADAWRPAAAAVRKRLARCVPLARGVCSMQCKPDGHSGGR